LENVERLAPSEMEEKIINGVRARNVGASATLDSFTSTGGMKKERKRLMFVHLD
jgi:hypothetical protein